MALQNTENKAHPTEHPFKNTLPNLIHKLPIKKIPDCKSDNYQICESF